MSSKFGPHGRVRSPMPGVDALCQMRRWRSPAGAGTDHRPNMSAGRSVPHMAATASRTAVSSSPAILANVSRRWPDWKFIP